MSYSVIHSARISEWRDFLAWVEEQETLPVVLACLAESARYHDGQDLRRIVAEERQRKAAERADNAADSDTGQTQQ
jgi:hypothetical protein